MATRILVCQANSCRRGGSEAVLLEIEELAAATGNSCRVNASNCLGYCEQAPAVAVWKAGRERIYTRIADVKKSAEVVNAASGRSMDLDDPVMLQRLQAARQLRVRQQACKESKWNLALATMTNDQDCQPLLRAKVISQKQRLQHQLEHGELLRKVGLWEEALDKLQQAQLSMDGTSFEGILAFAKTWAKLGRVDEIVPLEDQVRRICCDPEDFRLELELLSQLGKFKAEAEKVASTQRDRCIENYALWQLEQVTVVSKHSAVYHFVSKDRMRGTPNPRGRGRMVWPKVWHTTMLAMVGPNAEGPLPWVERDYTPISSSKDWENGRCDILIKVYRDGRATSWLHQQPLGSSVWLSQPLKTMGVPSLVPELDETAFRPASYLLLLAGTGIVVAEQVLHHTATDRCFGPFPAISSPIRLVQSCRSDDILMTNELLDWSHKGKLQSWTLLLTEAQAGMAPFPDFCHCVSHLAPAINVLHARVSKELIQKELGVSQKPCRVVVSGPAGFNAACKGMLHEVGCDASSITILSA